MLINLYFKFKLIPDKSNNSNERGIKNHVCVKKTTKLEKIGITDAELTISDPEWAIFDQFDQEVPQPLEIAIKSENSIDENLSTPFEAKIEYLTFETIDENERDHMQLHEFDLKEDFWILPSVCKPLDEVTANIKIPDRIAMVYDKLQEVDDDKNKDSKKFNRTRVLIDRTDNFKLYENADKDTIEIFKEKPKQLFKITKNLFCENYFNQKPATDSNELLKIFDELAADEKNKNAYHKVGTQVIRNIVTDVYKKEIDKDSNLTYITLYLDKIKSETSKNIHEPVQIRFEQFKKDDQKNILVNSQLYNIYGFENIENDDKLVEALDVSECIHKSQIIEFNLVAKRGELEKPKEDNKGKQENELDSNEKDEETEDLKNNKHLIKEGLRRLLMKTSGQTLLSFPKIEVEIHPKEIICYVKFIDYNSPLSYFKKYIKTPKFEKDKTPDNNATVNSGLECSIKALEKKEALGYQYCKNDHFCDLITNKDFSVTKDDKENCIIQEKISTTDYEKFDDKFKKIIDVIKKDGLSVDYLNKAYKFNQFYSIKEESDVDKSILYRLREKNQKLTAKSTKKKLELEDGIISLSSCYDACADPAKGFTCDTFSFCKKFGNLYDCNLGSLANEKMDNKKEDEYFEKDEDCNVYTVSSINHFVDHEKKKLKVEDEKKEIITILDETESDECAQSCLNQNMEKSKDRCLSIEVCQSEQASGKPICRLSRTETLFENSKKVEPDDKCFVYSVKHILNFEPTTKTKLQNFVTINSVTRIDHCANACDFAGDCDTFNYCKTDSGNTCRYKSKEGKDKTSLESEELGCVTYKHRSTLIGAPKTKRAINEIVSKTKSGNGFRVGSVFGFIVLFLLIGCFLGGAAFYGQKVYFNKRTEESMMTAVGFSNRDDV